MAHCVTHGRQIARTTIFLKRFVHVQTQTACSPAHMCFENLPDVHPRWHAQRVQTEIHRCTIREERHVFHRHHLGDDAFVPVTSGHLVARLELALHRDEDLDHLHHARRQIVAPADFLDLVLEPCVERALLDFILLVEGLDHLRVGLVLERQLPPLSAGQGFQNLFGDFRIGLEPLGALDGNLAEDHGLQTRVDVAVEDRQLVVPVTGQTFDFFALDLQRALIFFDAMAVEDADLDNGAEIARLHPQRGIAHVRGFLTENGAQEFFLWRHRAFALGCDLADENVARLHVGADIDNARLVEVAQRFLADVGDVARDLFRPELGVAGRDLEFLDMDRGKDVIACDAFGDQDRILVVVAVPGHEGDNDVLAERQFPHVGGRAIGDNLTFLNRIAHLDQRPLVDAGVLVRPLEFAHAVDINARIAQFQVLCCPDHDPLGIDLVDDTGTFRHDRRT